MGYAAKRSDWRTVVFTDEKKFNLDGPDGYHYYFHDLRKDKRFLNRRHSREGGVMVWGAITYYGTIDLEFQSAKMTVQAVKRYWNRLFRSSVNYLVPYLGYCNRIMPLYTTPG